MNHLDPLGLLNKKNTTDLNKNKLRNFVQLVAKNLEKDISSIKNKEESIGRLMAHIEVRNSFFVIFGSDGYVKSFEGKANHLLRNINLSYQRKIIRTSMADKKTLNYVFKQLVQHAVMYSRKAIEENNKESIMFSKGLLIEYVNLAKSLSSVLMRQNYSSAVTLLEQIKKEDD